MFRNDRNTDDETTRTDSHVKNDLFNTNEQLKTHGKRGTTNKA